MANQKPGIWLCLLILCSIGTPLAAQQANPYESDPRAAYAGGVIFRAQCATCHGADAKGIASIDAPDLTLMWGGQDQSDAAVFDTIRDGIPGSIMPAHGFPDPEIWMLVAYLKSIAVTGTSRTLTGDAAQGQTLFAANCARCHRVAGVGGSLGPDLTRITARRSYAALVESIRNPAATIGSGYRPVVLTLADGARVQGAIKSEDAFSIQLMNLEQQLRGYRKNAVREIVYPAESLMPRFSATQLDDRALDNILTYLQAQQ